MLDIDEDEKLTGEEEFELLAGPLGLNDRRIVPEPVQFPDSDPLGASVAMVTATNSMEETLMQIGNIWCSERSTVLPWVLSPGLHTVVRGAGFGCVQRKIGKWRRQ